MRFRRVGVIGLVTGLGLACGSEGPGTSGGEGTAASGGASGGDSPGIGGTYVFTSDGGSGSTQLPAEQNLVAFRIEPESVLMHVVPGESAQVEYRAFGRFASAPEVEVELSERTIFYVPDNYLVASFPADGSRTLSTRVPTDPSDPAQRAGRGTVQAQAANSDGTLTTAYGSFTVRIVGELQSEPGSPAATPTLPDLPSDHFRGLADPAHAPVLAYPNDGVLLPPNLGRLEVHFEPGAPSNTLFQVLLESDATELSFYTRCHSDPEQFVAGACLVELDGAMLDMIATSNQGQDLRLSVRGSDENGHYGQSATFDLELASERIDGGVYYWSATSPESIVRFDFGGYDAVPETFVGPDAVPGNDGSCVGCHALSRQGDKMFFSLGNSQRGELMYVGDMTRAASDPDFFTYNGAELDQELPLAERQNRVLTGSFDPTGDEFVAVAPVNDAESDLLLWFHDGNTGARTGSVALPFVPSHPEWSPLGDSIAVTAIGGLNGQTISFLGAGISLVQREGSNWLGDAPVTIVAPEAGKSRFNPTFLRDASLLLFSEVDQAQYSGGHAAACDSASVSSGGRFCNGYSDPGAKTWAVAPEAGATPVLLANAAAPGVADALFATPQASVGATGLMDTFPKPTPFLNQHRGNALGWFTVSSQRRAGLRRFFPNPSVVGDPASQALLWMFAIEPARVLNGEDGSRPGFFLPFQDLTTSNHMAQWTERIVSEAPPAPPPVPPSPQPPPPAPPPPDIY